MTNPQSSNFITLFLLLAFFVWLYRSFRLLITRLRTPLLKPARPRDTSIRVSILIPAKNEAGNIRECLQTLQSQDYPSCEIIVINDNSTDATESILKDMGVFYLNCPLPPEGWTGKNHALAYGVKHAKGDWILFTDADTRHHPHTVSSALAHVEAKNLDFLSLLPKCLTGSVLEEILQPSAMAYLGLWFPFEKVNDPANPLYFANGQFLFIRKKLYDTLGGHETVAQEFLEDFALMKLSKQAGAKAECSLGMELYGTRMYDSWNAIWRGWRRIYLHAFERNPFPLLKNAVMIFLFSVFPFVLPFFLFAQKGLEWTLSLGIILWVLSIAWGAHRIVRAKGVYALFHPLAAFVIVLILLDAAGMAIRKQKTVWR